MLLDSRNTTAHICRNVTESLGQLNCLHFALENGCFKRLHPQPKIFNSDGSSRRISLSALFKRQQELLGGSCVLPSSCVLPLKGRRILAVTLATALLPFLETPWIQPSFNHSKIQFFEPRQDGELPDITKPFLALEHMPTISTRKADAQAELENSKQRVHPNASVLALGILLCELHFCTSVELMRQDPDAPITVNTDYYACLDKLKLLEDEAGEDYYLAATACVTGNYYHPGQQADFESADVQRLFHENVIKRLEADVFKSWRLRLEHLVSLDSRTNAACWGAIGQEFIRSYTRRTVAYDPHLGSSPALHRAISDDIRPKVPSFGLPLALRTSKQSAPTLQGNCSAVEPSGTGAYFFDATRQENPLQAE
jgi:hypothetical protein